MTDETTPKKPGPKPKVKVKIAVFRGVPTTGGVFLGDGLGKLVPGETREMTKEAFDALSEECRELLKLG